MIINKSNKTYEFNVYDSNVTVTIVNGVKKWSKEPKKVTIKPGESFDCSGVTVNFVRVGSIIERNGDMIIIN